MLYLTCTMISSVNIARYGVSHAKDGYLHWLGAYRTNALYSGHTYVRFNDLEDVFT